MGSKNNGKYTLGIVVVLGLLAVGYLATDGFKSAPAASVSSGTSTFGSTPPADTTTTLKKTNPVTISLSHKDAGDSTSKTEATNVKTTALYPTSLGGYAAGPATSNSAIAYFMPDDTGYAYLSFETQASGQAFAFDPEKTKSVNDRDISCTYGDWELDGAREYICKVSTEGLSGQYALTQSATLPLTVMWNNIGWGTLSAPSDVSSIGSTAGTATYTQYTFTSTKGDSVYLGKITIQKNSTNYSARWNEADEYVKIKDLNIQWSLVPSAMPYTDAEGKQYTVTRSTDGTNTIYEIFYGTRLAEAKKIDLPNNGSGILALEIKNVWNTPGLIVETLKLDGVNEIDGGQTQRTDAVSYST